MRATKIMSLIVLWLTVVILSYTSCARHDEPVKGKRVRSIGVANYGAHPVLDIIIESFKERLAERGYVEGDGIKIIWKSVEGDVNLATSVANSLLNSSVDVIVPITTPISQAVYNVALGKVPIVFCGVTDPLSAGLVDSWNNKPGSGITGTSDRWPYAAQLDLIKLLIPNAIRIGFPCNPGEANSRYALTQIIPLAEERGLKIVDVGVTNLGEVRKAIEALTAQGIDAIYVSSDNTVMAGFEGVLKVAHEQRIPVIVGESANVERGGVATYSVNYRRLGQVTADIVIRVLGGEDPGNIPVATFEGEELYLNLDAAAKMGLELDSALIRRAYKVYRGDSSTAR